MALITVSAPRIIPHPAAAFARVNENSLAISLVISLRRSQKPWVSDTKLRLTSTMTLICFSGDNVIIVLSWGTVFVKSIKAAIRDATVNALPRILNFVPNGISCSPSSMHGITSEGALSESDCLICWASFSAAKFRI